MPAPTPLAIATSAVNRLVKEEKYYKKELAAQTQRVGKLAEDFEKGGADKESNAEFMLKQEQKALEETKAVFAPLADKITEAVQRLEEQIASAEGDESLAGDMAKAQEALALGNASAEAADK